MTLRKKQNLLKGYIFIFSLVTSLPIALKSSKLVFTYLISWYYNLCIHTTSEKKFHYFFSPKPSKLLPSSKLTRLGFYTAIIYVGL